MPPTRVPTIDTSDDPCAAMPPKPVPGAPVGMTGVVVVDSVVMVEVVVVELVVVVAIAAHSGTVMALLSKVTAPFLASARPSRLAPLSSVIDVNAKMEPTKLVVVPMVADEPTCQKTLQACAPFSRITELDEPVVNVDPA